MFRALLLAALAWPLMPPLLMADVPDSIENLWTQWRSGDERAHAILTELGPECRDLAPRLAEALAESDGEIDWRTYDLLSAMQADAVPDILKALERCLSDTGRKKLVEQLAAIGPMARAGGDALVTIAMEDAGDLREAALSSLAAVQCNKDFLVPELVRMLSQSSPYFNGIRFPLIGPDRLAAFAAAELAKSPDPRALLPLFGAAHFHPNSHVRTLALQTLVTSYRYEVSVASLLIDKLDDSAANGGLFFGGSVSQSALAWLQQYESLPRGAAPRLISRLYRASFEPPGIWPNQLCEMICRCPTTDKIASALVNQKLKRLLDDDALIIDNHFPGGPELERKRMQVAAASVILKWEPGDQIAGDLLSRVAGEEGRQNFHGPKGIRVPDVRAEAARGLGRVGNAGRKWLPLLHSTMQRETRAIGLREPPTELAIDAAWAVAQIDPDDEQCLDVLRQAVTELRDMRRLPWSHVEAILGKRATRLTDRDAVLKELATPRGSQHGFKEWDWQRIESHFAAVAPVLFEHLSSDRISERRAAVVDLSHFRSHAAVAIPKLIEALRDPRATVRAEAAKALGGFQPLTQEALEALERATRDNFRTVRFSAQDALAANRRSPDQ